MKKTLAILKHEFLQTIRQKGYIIMVISLPLLSMVGYGVAQAVDQWSDSDSGEAQTIGYVDAAGMLGEEYTGTADIEFVQYSTDAEAKESLLNDQVDEYFIVPENYVSTGLIVRFTSEGETGLSGEIEGAMEGFLLDNLLAGDVGDDLMERVKTPMMLASYGLDGEGEIVPESDELNAIVIPMIFGILFMFCIFTSSGFMLESVSEEKENRVMEILLSSVSAKQLLLGKILGRGVAGLLQVVIWLTTAVVFARMASISISVLEDLSISFDVLGLGLLYFVLGYFIFAALMAGVGCIGATMKESQSLSMMITMPAGLLPFYLFIFTQETEGPIFTALTLFPLTAPVMGIIRVSAHTIPVWELMLSLLFMAGTSVFLLWAVAKIFRTFLLMYGKKPSVRDIVRSVMAA